MTDNRQFSVDLTAFVLKGKANMDEIVRKVVFALGTDIVSLSPVGDGNMWKSPPPKGYIGGRFRANWQYGNTETGEPQGELPDIDPSGRASINRIVNGLPLKAGGLVHMLRNNLPYAERLETGWSKQAPGGMVGVTVLRFTNFVEQAARNLK